MHLLFPSAAAPQLTILLLALTSLIASSTTTLAAATATATTALPADASDTDSTTTISSSMDNLDMNVPNWYALASGEARAFSADRMLQAGGRCSTTPADTAGPFYVPDVGEKNQTMSFCEPSSKADAGAVQNLTLRGRVLVAGGDRGTVWACPHCGAIDSFAKSGRSPRVPVFAPILASLSRGAALLPCAKKNSRKNWLRVNATVELWQANNAGDYDNSRRTTDCRTTLKTTRNGKYSAKTIMPANYGSTNCLRPAHVHARVSALGYQTLTTQIYFKNDPFLGDNDCACSSCNSELLKLQTRKTCTNGNCKAKFDFYLAEQ
eukprot:gene30170-35154_t